MEKPKTKGKGIKIVIGNKNEKHLKKRKIHNPYGDLYRRRKSFFNFRTKGDASPEVVRRQVSEPAPLPEYESESRRRQISEPNQPFQCHDGYNNNNNDNNTDSNNNPWELRQENDEAKIRPQGRRFVHIYSTIRFWKYTI